MNQFLELILCNDEGTVCVRPEHVSAVERRNSIAGEFIVMLSGETYLVAPGQFVVSKLINRTSHAGMKVL